MSSAWTGRQGSRSAGTGLGRPGPLPHFPPPLSTLPAQNAAPAPDFATSCPNLNRCARRNPPILARRDALTQGSCSCTEGTQHLATGPCQPPASHHHQEDSAVRAPCSAGMGRQGHQARSRAPAPGSAGGPAGWCHPPGPFTWESHSNAGTAALHWALHLLPRRTGPGTQVWDRVGAALSVSCRRGLPERGLCGLTGEGEAGQRVEAAAPAPGIRPGHRQCLHYCLKSVAIRRPLRRAVQAGDPAPGPGAALLGQWEGLGWAV